MIKANGLNVGKSAKPDLARPTKDLRHSDLIVPLLEHGLLGFAWYLLGLWVFRQFNESAVGFLGVVILLWAGVRALILLGIYGYALYALLFRQEWFVSVAERRHITRVNGRIERDLEAGRTALAMDRLHGLLVSYPDNMGLRRRLSLYLMEEGRLADAGRFLALHPNPTDTEREAVRAFCEANGNDPFQILRKVIRGIDGLGLSRASRAALQAFYENVARDADKASWVYLSVDRYLRYSSRKWSAMFWENYRTALIEVCVLALAATFFFSLL